MPKFYTPAVRFANSGSAAFKSVSQTAESVAQVPSDHAVASQHFAGVVRFRKDWRFHDVVAYLFNPVPAACNPSVAVPATPAYAHLTGANFVSGSTVWFDDVLVTPSGAQYVDENHLDFQAPVWPEEDEITIKVIRPDGRTGSADGLFRYERYPILASVAPATGFVQGSDAVALQGFYIKNDSTVRFVSGATVLTTTEVTYMDQGDVEVLTPAAPTTGTYNIYIKSPSGLESGEQVTFLYVYRPPVITMLVPASRSTDGGEVVLVMGAYFLSGAIVQQDSASLTTSFSAGTCSFITPAHAAGTASISVLNPDGQVSNAVPFRYVLGLPTVKSITPSLGSTGSVFAISGTYLSSSIDPDLVVTSMWLVNSVGGATASITQFTLVSATSATFVMPSASVGDYYVAVSSAAGIGSSSPTTVGYRTAPIIFAVNPSSGGLAGNFPVDITGTNFLPPGNGLLQVGGVSCSFTYIGPNNIRVTMPSRDSTGSVSIVFTNYGRFSGSSTFTYISSDSILSGTTWVPDLGPYYY